MDTNANARRLVGVLDSKKLSADAFTQLAHAGTTWRNAAPLDVVYIKHGEGEAVVRFACTLEAHGNKVRVRGCNVEVDGAYPHDVLLGMAMRVPQVTTTPNVFMIHNNGTLAVWLHSYDAYKGADVWAGATQEQRQRWGVQSGDTTTASLTMEFGATIQPRLRAEGLLGVLVVDMAGTPSTPQQLLDRERDNNISKSIYRFIQTTKDAVIAGEVLQALRARSWAGMDGVSKTPLGLSGLMATAHRSRDNDEARSQRFDLIETVDATRAGVDKDGNVVEVAVKHVKLKLSAESEATATRRRHGRGKHKDLAGQVSLFVDESKGAEGESVEAQAVRLIMRYDVPAIQAAHVLLGEALRSDSQTVLATPTNLAALLGKTHRLNGDEYKALSETIAVVEAMGVDFDIDKSRKVVMLMFDREATVLDRNTAGTTRAYHILKPSPKLFAAMYAKDNKGRGSMFVLDDLARMDAAVCDLEIRLGYVACEEHALGFATRYAKGQTPYRTLGYWARESCAYRTLERLKDSRGLPAMRARVEQAATNLAAIGLDVVIDWDNASVWDSRVTFTAQRLALAQHATRGDILTAAKAKHAKYLDGKVATPKRRKQRATKST